MQKISDLTHEVKKLKKKYHQTKENEESLQENCDMYEEELRSKKKSWKDMIQKEAKRRKIAENEARRLKVTLLVCWNSSVLTNPHLTRPKWRSWNSCWISGKAPMTSLQATMNREMKPLVTPVREFSCPGGPSVLCFYRSPL